MATKIIHKKSSVTNRVPVSGDLEVGEIALNLTDQKIYSKQSDGTVVEMAPADDSSDKLPLAGGTLTGDVTFTGASYNAVWDNSANSLRFADNAMAVFGDGGDASIHWNGSALEFTSELGDVVLRGNNEIKLQSHAGDNFFVGLAGGASTIYHNDSAKLATTSTGVDVTGNVSVSGTVDGRDIATNIPASLGTAGQVLTVNSGATAGEWADANGGFELISENPDGTATAPSATGDNSIAMGDGATAVGDNSFTFGDGASAAGAHSIAIGHGAQGGAFAYGIAIGNSSQAYNKSTAIGYDNITNGASSLAIGSENRTLTYENAVALGNGVTSTATNQVSIGANTQDVRISEVYTLPKVDGTADQVLKTDGSGAVTWQDAGGGSTYTKTLFVATASQTTFTATYTAGRVDVYSNGVKLVDITDYTATNGTSVVLTSGAVVGDNIEVIAWDTFEVANAASSAQGALADGALLRANLTSETDVKAIDQSLTTTAVPTFKNVTETVFAVTGTTPALDPANGSIQTWTLSGASTPTDSFSAGESITLMIDDGTAYGITWPTMKWAGGEAPTLATTDYSVVVLWKVGATLYGASVGDMS